MRKYLAGVLLFILAAVVVTQSQTYQTQMLAVQGGAPNGSATFGNPVLIGGSDGTNARSLLIDSLGSIAVTSPVSNVAPATAEANGIVAVALSKGLSGTGIPLAVMNFGVDPCQSSGVLKSSVAINITSAATTSLVAVSGSTKVYVCGAYFTISEVVTTPNTLQFEYGTGASCTSPTALTGLFGGGGVTAGDPIVINMGEIGATPASQGVCALTAIGATGSFQGVLTYVQQ